MTCPSPRHHLASRDRIRVWPLSAFKGQALFITLPRPCPPGVPGLLMREPETLMIVDRAVSYRPGKMPVFVFVCLLVSVLFRKVSPAEVKFNPSFRMSREFHRQRWSCSGPGSRRLQGAGFWHPGSVRTGRPLGRK